MKLSWLRYLLIWPLVLAYRERARRSLRWRLIGSHLLATFAVPAVGLLLIALIGMPFGLYQAWNQQHDEHHGAKAARELADRLEEVGREGSLNVRRTNRVALTDTAGVIERSRPSGLAGRSARDFAPGSDAIVAAALSGSTDTARNNLAGANGHAIGAFPVFGNDGDLEGIVLVDDPPLSAGVLADVLLDSVVSLLLATVVTFGIYLIPGFAAAAYIGIKRANAIARPLQHVSSAALAISTGDLKRRVSDDSEDEIGVLSRSFNAMAGQVEALIEQESEARALAERSLAANRDLVANVSHELRTPIALIRGHLEALQEGSDGSGEYARIALRETVRLGELVDDLFLLARVESGASMVTVAAFDAAAAVREAVESLAEVARREASILVRADILQGELQASGDRARLVQVLQNLIRNAIRYTPEGGIVLVAGRELADAIEVRVSDTGTGIAPEDLPHVFERLYRGDASRSRSSGGTGLGLAIAKEMIEAMDGGIEAESPPGEGATFRMRLPKA